MPERSRSSSDVSAAITTSMIRSTADRQHPPDCVVSSRIAVKPLLEAGGWLIPEAETLGRHIKIKRPGTFLLLRGIHTVQLGINSHALEIFDIRVDDLVKGRRAFQNSTVRISPSFSRRPSSFTNQPASSNSAEAARRLRRSSWRSPEVGGIIASAVRIDASNKPSSTSVEGSQLQRHLARRLPCCPRIPKTSWGDHTGQRTTTHSTIQN